MKQMKDLNRNKDNKIEVPRDTMIKLGNLTLLSIPVNSCYACHFRHKTREQCDGICCDDIACEYYEREEGEAVNFQAFGGIDGSA